MLLCVELTVLKRNYNKNGNSTLKIVDAPFLTNYKFFSLLKEEKHTICTG